MALDPNDARPPYRQIAGDLRQAIADGRIKPGDRLPSTAELMDRYDVASQTVQNAVRQLRTEGLARSVQGRGTYVMDDVDPKAIEPDAGGRGPSPEYLALRVHLDRLTTEVAEIRATLDEIVAERKPPPKKKRPAKR